MGEFKYSNPRSCPFSNGRNTVVEGAGFTACMEKDCRFQIAGECALLSTYATVKQLFGMMRTSGTGVPSIPRMR